MSAPGGMFTPERSQRSVFVGNIPYEATEDEMKEIFVQVGPVYGFRLVHDRESGKPKGYGFCEFLDQETAMSAMRNLNGFEFRGRQLRVDSATGEKTREELAQLQAAMGPPPEESPFGAPVDPVNAPENISRAVASLPPEQMFELMKQMKLCVQNNPNEARNMLLQNPQLAYALLQAQVVMRIVDPQVAMAMLHRPEVTTSAAPVLPTSGSVAHLQNNNAGGPGPSRSTPPNNNNMSGGGGGMDQHDYRNPVARLANSGPPARQSPNPGLGPPGQGPPQGPTGVTGLGLLPTPGGIGGPHGIGGPPIAAGGVGAGLGGPPSAGGPPGGPTNPQAAAAQLNASGPPADDQEKAQLIMQVLQLSDEQIALLPPDQRQSVLILKEQLKGATG